jgi:intracellular multiplication protein IcmD
LESKVSTIVSKKHKIVSWSCIGLGLLLTGSAFAAGDSDLGAVAAKITTSFEAVGKLITAGSYLAGLGFAIGGILKFKQHKDNPTQVTIGQPIALVFVAAALLFLPSVLTTLGDTMFSGQQKTAGPGGVEITK